MRKILLLVAMLLLFASHVFSQTRTITGTVTDESGKGIPDVSVMIKGTSTGTITNDAGIFTLDVPANRNVLVISAIGSGEKEVTIGGASNLSIILSQNTADMDEVIVVAYGQQKRSSITGSLSTVTAEDLEGRLTSNISQALAGAAPGISATSGNGQPGSSAGLRIRGFGSINASGSPLYVVDGFPYEGFIGDLNTNDIESFTILKDATSSALYGARAANGVILITTKKGRSATPKVTLNLTTGFSQRGIPEYDRVGTFDYYPVVWRAYRNSLIYPASGIGLTPSAASIKASNDVAGLLVYNPFDVPGASLVDTTGSMNPNAKLLYNDFDWYGPLSQNGPRNEAALSISSSLNKTDYLVSLNYLKDEGFIKKSDYERVTGRVNINTQVRSWFKTGLNISGILVKSNLASATDDNTSSFINPFVFARGIGPIYPVHAYDALGKPILTPTGEHYYDYGIHPGSINRPQSASPGRNVIYETLLNTNNTKRNSLIGRTYFEFKFLKDFTFTNNIGIDLNNVRNITFQNKIVGDGVTSAGYSYRSSNEFKNVTMNQILNYVKNFGRHNITFLAGHETQWVDETYFDGFKRGQNIVGNIELVNFVNMGGISGQVDAVRREAYLSRVNYGYDTKYFFDLSYRRDGSSRFSPSKRWGNFFSVGASWNAYKEEFIKNISALNDLRFRIAYGTVGNDNLTSYYLYNDLYSLTFNNATEPGVLGSQLGNPNLTWEVGKTFTLGVDFGLFKNRISGNIEYFQRGSSRLLFDVPRGLSAQLTTLTDNIGTMVNRGVEIQLSNDIIRTENTKWNLTINFTALKNEITKLPGGNPITSGTKRLEEGKDLYAFYLRKWYGVDPTDGAALYKKADNVTTGYRVTPLGDSVVTNPTNAKFEYVGSAIPKFFGSINNTFNFKGFFLSTLLNYQVGGKFYDGTYAGLMALSNSYGKSVHVDVLKAWKNPGDVTDIPRLDVTSSANFNSQSSRFLIDASYLNIRNLTFGYSFPKTIVDKLKIDLLKVFLSGENVKMFSKRKGLNPAESFSGTNSNIYVPNRVLSFGLNLTF